jgi:endonuclease VIII
VPEGDTIHRVARRLNAALGDREIEVAEAPNPRSPLHRRADELAGTTLVEAEAIGKHLLAHFSGDLVLHSHLGMTGRWSVRADGARVFRRPWLLLAAAAAVAAQNGGKTLRLTSEGRARNDPALRRLGPDPLREGFEVGSAADRLRRLAAGLEIGEALLDQEIIAGIGNAIRIEGLFRARVSPWRRVDDLAPAELESIVAESAAVMRVGFETGRRPSSIHGGRRACPVCGGRIESRGQGDSNRVAYWCSSCQR